MSFLLYLLLFVSTVYLVLACGPLNKNLLGGKYEFIDLAFAFSSQIVEFEHDENNTSKASSATGPDERETYMIAPAEYELSGNNVGDIPEEKLIVQLLFFNISLKMMDNPYFILHMSDLESMLNNDTMDKLKSWPTLIVFGFWWTKYYRDYVSQHFYYENSTFDYPAIGDDVTDWLTKNETTKKVVGVGTDLYLWTEDGGLNNLSTMRQTLARAGLYVIENLNLTTLLPDYDCIAVVSPLKIDTASRVPTNVVAICPKHSEMLRDTRSKRHTHEHHVHDNEHHMHKHELQMHEAENYTNHKSEHRSKRHISGHHKDNDTEEYENTEHHHEEHMCHKCEHHNHEKKEETNGQDITDKKDTDKRGSTQSSSKGDTKDQKGNNNKKPTQGGPGNTELSSGNIPQKVIDGVQSIKDKLKIPG